MTESVYIYDAIRTPRGKGKKGGALYSMKPVALMANVLNSLKERNNLDTDHVDDIVLGCVTPVGEQGANIAKTAALLADWSERPAGMQINRFCASGLEAVNIAAQKIASGWEDLVVAGGVEVMSRVPMGSDGGPMAMDPETSFGTYFVPQGIGADTIATMEGFSREDVDNFALNSQRKAAEAWTNNAFEKSVVPVKDQNGVVLLEKDELVRPDASIEALSALKPSFAAMGQMGFDSTALRKYSHLERINHIHTPGNSSGIVDGATAILMGNQAKGEELGLTARGRIVATAVTSTDPTTMLTGPTPSTLKVLEKANMTVDQIDLFEVNEAFAAVVMKFQKDLGVPDEKVNVNGGSIAMGHPLGATGAIIIGIVLDELERRDQRYGLCTLCVGGGMGIATIVENINCTVVNSAANRAETK